MMILGFMANYQSLLASGNKRPGPRRSLRDSSWLAGLCDWTVFFTMCLICTAGLVTLWSAGFDADRGESAAMMGQGKSMILGLIAFVICNSLNAQVWRKFSIPLFVLSMLLLAYILLNGVVVQGSRRWLDIGFFRMQPSELSKLATIVLLATYFSSDRCPRDGHSLLKMFGPLFLILLPTALIVDQPDLGTAMCHVLVGCTMLLLAGIQCRVLLISGALGILLLVPIWEFGLKDYQKLRVLTFIDPERDALGSGYHAIQSKIAVGSGAIFGKGFMQGSQTQLRFLPEQTTDFIFSVFSEEWGFVGTLGVLICYVLLIRRLIQIASATNDRFSSYVCFGVAALFFWHVFVNMGMVIGIVPVVGITLPLFSFGGSSVITLMACLGIASSIGRKRYYFSS